MKDYTYIVEIKKTMTANNEDEAEDKLIRYIQKHLSTADIIDVECVEEGEQY